MPDILNSQKLHPSNNKEEIGLKGIFNPIYGSKMEETLRAVISQMDVSMFEEKEKRLQNSSQQTTAKKQVIKHDTSSINEYYKKNINLDSAIEKMESGNDTRLIINQQKETPRKVAPVEQQERMKVAAQTVKRASNVTHAVTLGENSYYRKVGNLDVAIRDFESGGRPKVVIPETTIKKQESTVRKPADVIKFDDAAKTIKSKAEKQRIAKTKNNIAEKPKTSRVKKEKQLREEKPKVIKTKKEEKPKVERTEVTKTKKEKKPKVERTEVIKTKKEKKPKVERAKVTKTKKEKKPKVERAKVTKTKKEKKPKVERAEDIKTKKERPSKVKKSETEKKTKKSKKENVVNEEKRTVKNAKTLEEMGRLTEPKKRGLLGRIILQIKYSSGSYEFIEDAYKKGIFTREGMAFYKDAEDEIDRENYKEVQEYEDAANDVSVRRGWTAFRLGLATTLLAGAISFSKNVIQDVKNSAPVKSDKEITIESISEEQFEAIKKEIGEIKTSSNYDFKNLTEEEQVLAALKIRVIEKGLPAKTFERELLAIRDQEFLNEILQKTFLEEYNKYSNEKIQDLKKLAFELLPDEKQKFVRDPQVLIELEQKQNAKSTEDNERD